MTLPEQLESAEAGSRELDVLIAVAVKWDIYGGGIKPFHELAEDFGMEWAVEIATHYDSAYRSLPHYTTSLDAAMTLYKHMPDVISSCPRKVVADALRQRISILGEGQQGGKE